ncbi:MAG: hypothetical protein CMH83_14560 [Nocardioides sp.]|nr:hypothetical protein [Nocardioides sp.]
MGSGGGSGVVPPIVATFLGRESGAVLLPPDGSLAAGAYPRVAVVLPASGGVAVYDGEGGSGGSVRATVVGVLVAEPDVAPVPEPRPEWPPLVAQRATRVPAGWWLVLRFARPVDVTGPTGVVAAVGRALAGGRPGRLVVPRADPAAYDVRRVNPAGWRAEVDGPVLDLADAVPADVTPAVVAGLRDARGVRATTWSPEVAHRVAGLALAGVPVVAAPGVDLPAPWAGLLDAPVGGSELDDEVAREEHSVLLRRVGFEVAVGGAVPWPTVSVVLATRRPELLDHALAQVARQVLPAGAPGLELVLAPHGYDVEAARVRAAVGPSVTVQVVPSSEQTVFGTVLDRASSAASGDLVLKMDDDDWYAPEFVADLLRARACSGAALVGTPPEWHYLAGPDLTVRRGHTSEHHASFVAGGTMLVERDLLREVGGWWPVPRSVDAALLADVRAAGATVYRTHGYGYLLRRETGGSADAAHAHTWRAELDELLAPERTRATYDGFAPSRLLGLGPADSPAGR